MMTMLCRICLVVSLAGAASAADVDPWEPMNRKIYVFNDAFDRWLLRPVAVGYTKVIPSIVRRGVGNFFRNLRMPVVFVNQFLQGKPSDGVNDMTRMLMNTTLGIGGIFDVATPMGLADHDEDFAQTFAVWGVPRGPYFVLPFLGPSSVRGGVGYYANVQLHPVQLVNDRRIAWAMVGVWAVQTRSELLALDSIMTGDRYLFMRDAYIQSRDYLISDGEVEEDPFLDDDF